jgi:hypothetical protein
MVEAQRLSPAHSEGSAHTGEISVGETLGKYEILQRLATGGMAEIFLARVVGVLGFDKLVVIKRILPHLAKRTDFIQMFLDEARIATTLAHANIVHTHEVGVHGKSYFIVMEYLAGEDVRTIVRQLARDQKRLPLQHSLQIVSGIAAGLHYAHEKKDRDKRPLDIVHRDVTPQNVIVTYDGAVKLVDFGIAKAANRINETRSGSFKGKVPYMSPEQCRGDALDRRTDVFSLGIMLYEMTLGRRLFLGDTDFQILKQIAEGPIPQPRTVEESYDPRLQAIVLKALERDPARRFQTAREMQVAIEELAHELRLRLSPLGLADYMRALFADKINRWEQAAADGDVAKLEAHFATVMAEREADLAAEEATPRPRALGPASLLPGEVPVSSLPPAVWRPRRGRTRVLVIGFAAAFLVTLAAVALRGHVVLHRTVAAPTARMTSPPAAMARVTATVAVLDVTPAAPTTATLEVTTSPPGATLVLDGATLADKSPARLGGLTPGVAHTLIVRREGRPGVAQRFVLDAGEEATMEIDLKRTQRASVGGSAVKRPSAARARATTAPPPVPVAPAAAPAPIVKQGDGTLVLASSPWCNVVVDGQPRGTTPLNVKLKAGSHQVLLANPEFKIKRTLAIEVEPGQTVRKSLDFAPE